MTTIASIIVECASNPASLTMPGSYTWTVPAGVSTIDISATGGGGGGGGGTYGTLPSPTPRPVPVFENLAAWISETGRSAAGVLTTHSRSFPAIPTSILEPESRASVPDQ